MNKETSIWANNEKKALDMVIDKMRNIGIMSDDFKPITKHGVTKDQINEMFEMYLNHYKRICHAHDPVVKVQKILLDTLDTLEDRYIKNGAQKKW